MDKYTLELTFDELKIVARALAYEVDRLDGIRSPRLGDVEDLDGRVHDIYMNARRFIEHERSRAVMERGRV